MMNHCCIITTAHPPFDIRIFHKQVRSLVKAGYRVTLIAQHDRHETVDGVEIIPLPKSRNRVLRMFRTFTAFNLALKQKADVYHFHDPELLPVGWLLQKWTGKPSIYDVHEHYPNSIMDKYWIPKKLRVIVRKGFELVESVIVPSLAAVVYTTPIVGQRYIKMNVRTERIENLPLLSLFSNSKPIQMVDQTHKIIYVGGMTKIRGLIELIIAFSYLVRTNSYGTTLILIGKVTPDEFKDEIETLIKELNLETKVRIIEQIPYEKVKDYLLQADIGVVTYLPYTNNMSCLPNKLFEYMACGLPVIASDFPLYREVVDDVGFGILVDPTSPESIAEAMERLLSNPIARNVMSERAKKGFLEKYNWESESKKLLKLYSELLSEQFSKSGDMYT